MVHRVRPSKRLQSVAFASRSRCFPGLHQAVEVARHRTGPAAQATQPNVDNHLVKWTFRLVVRIRVRRKNPAATSLESGITGSQRILVDRDCLDPVVFTLRNLLASKWV